jgi:hypothetical protein
MGKEKRERKTKMYLLSPILRNYKEPTATGSFFFMKIILCIIGSFFIPPFKYICCLCLIEVNNRIRYKFPTNKMGVSLQKP